MGSHSRTHAANLVRGFSRTQLEVSILQASERGLTLSLLRVSRRSSLALLFRTIRHSVTDRRQRKRSLLLYFSCARLRDSV